jgi:hypothetical protein
MKAMSMFVVISLLIVASCKHATTNPNQKMVERLQQQDAFENNTSNPYAVNAQLMKEDSIINKASPGTSLFEVYINKANTLLQMGLEQKAVNLLDSLQHTFMADYLQHKLVLKDLALANLRLGERTNCINNHSADACVFPIKGDGVQAYKSGSQKAINLYTAVLKDDPFDFESRWLLNMAYMTIGEYPAKVPAKSLLQMDSAPPITEVKPFTDVAINLGLAVKKMGGGSIVDDFDNDGYPDIITSSNSLKESMHYFHNNKNGTFSDWSASSGISSFTGGLNMIQTDYNNDGFKDILVLRGAWRGKFGKEPNSLLRNNGNGTFTDVTEQSGLLSFHPTQTATWADFNNDGWLDLFIGNESTTDDVNPSELYINNKNGTFTEMAAKAGCDVKLFVKGVISGDYNNDGLPDIFISTMNGQKVLLKNITGKDGMVKFTDVSQQANLTANRSPTFSTWFWDYDNDGWLDILVCGYGNSIPIGYAAGAEALNRYQGDNGKVILYHNEHNGTFKDVSKKAGFNKISFAMGGNFGDIDNDGYLDFYLGTGNPLFSSLVPNKLYKNKAGLAFTDVTTAARVGSLQKGHAISFADLDNDGNEDIYISQGGAYPGDAYQNALFVNPGQSNNNWVNIQLEGTHTNKAAIGVKLKLCITDNGVKRSVYREVNSGGSFGANPLTQHLGLGKASIIDTIQITWPVTHQVEYFKHVATNANFKLKEGMHNLQPYVLKKLNFSTQNSGVLCVSK